MLVKKKEKEKTSKRKKDNNMNMDFIDYVYLSKGEEMYDKGYIEDIYHVGKSDKIKRRKKRYNRGVTSLSERERSVLEFIIKGWTNEEVSRHLFISEATVKKHVGSIFKKFSVENRVQAAVKAVRLGIF